MVIIKTNQTPLILEMDRYEVRRQKSPFGINGLMLILRQRSIAPGKAYFLAKKC